jgi:hypothetical protein
MGLCNNTYMGIMLSLYIIIALLEIVNIYFLYLFRVTSIDTPENNASQGGAIGMYSSSLLFVRNSIFNKCYAYRYL